MARGWATPISPDAELPAGPPIVGVVVAQKFPDVQLIRDVARRIESERSDSCVVLQWGSGAAKEMREFLDILGVEYLLVKGNAHYWGHNAQVVLATELALYCDQLIVLHEKNSTSTVFYAKKKEQGLFTKVHLVSRGEKRAVKKTRRKKVTA